MEPIFIYLLKMLVCSAVLFGYYRLALYNVRFHRWNRFYLLAAMVLSVVAPLVNIPIQAHAQNQRFTSMVTSLPWNSALAPTPVVTIQQVAYLAFATVTIVLLAKAIAGIVHMVRLYNNHTPVQVQANVQFILTRLSNAPFSFFNWLFWRSDIDVASPNGTRMLNHELAHIRQGHSFDKLFTSLLLCIFWMNPFFWLIRRELNMIHEFLADHEAVGQQNGAAFAAMILQTMPAQLTQHNGLSNPFFSSNIKRRLFMITSSTQPKYSYLRRISGLAAMIIIVCTLAITVQQAQAQQANKKPAETLVSTDTTKPSIQLKTTIVKNRAADGKNAVKDPAGFDDIHIVIDTIKVNNNKTVVTKITGHSNIIVKEQTKSGKALKDAVSKLTVEANDLPMDKLNDNVLYMVDGKKASANDVKDIDPNTIQAISVYKGETAVKMYGAEGKDGVVEITLKKLDAAATPGGVVVLRGNKQPAANPLILVNGREVTRDEMNLIKPNDIESIDVLKGQKAIDKYGSKATDGAIEITMKKPVT